ncbi:hypothetical protein BJ912DRAFT_927110 [Pholiota molesta]|nr:hypothetical protein BJ912DRAFT_927110 [Pholiota molesta]
MGTTAHSTQAAGVPCTTTTRSRGIAGESTETSPERHTKSTATCEHEIWTTSTHVGRASTFRSNQSAQEPRSTGGQGREHRAAYIHQNETQWAGEREEDVLTTSGFGTHRASVPISKQTPQLSILSTTPERQYTTERDREENIGALPASVKRPARTDRLRAREGDPWAPRRAAYGYCAAPRHNGAASATSCNTEGRPSDLTRSAHIEAAAGSTATPTHETAPARARRRPGRRRGPSGERHGHPCAQKLSSRRALDNDDAIARGSGRVHRAADKDHSEGWNTRARYLADIGARRRSVDVQIVRQGSGATQHGRRAAPSKLGNTAAQQRYDCNRERQGRAAGSLGVTGKPLRHLAASIRVSTATTAYEKEVDNLPGAERRRGRRSAREDVIDVRRLCASYKRMRGGPAEWVPAHERRCEQLGALFERPPICSTYQRGRRLRTEGPVKKRRRRARFLGTRRRGWPIQSCKGTAPTYRAASARTKGLAGAMSSARKGYLQRKNDISAMAVARRMEYDVRAVADVRCGESDHIDEWRRTAPTRSSRTIELGEIEEEERRRGEELRGEERRGEKSGMRE